MRKPRGRVFSMTFQVQCGNGKCGWDDNMHTIAVTPRQGASVYCTKCSSKICSEEDLWDGFMSDVSSESWLQWHNDNNSWKENCRWYEVAVWRSSSSSRDASEQPGDTPAKGGGDASTNVDQ